MTACTRTQPYSLIRSGTAFRNAEYRRSLGSHRGGGDDRYGAQRSIPYANVLRSHGPSQANRYWRQSNMGFLLPWL